MDREKKGDDMSDGFNGRSNHNHLSVSSKRELSENQRRRLVGSARRSPLRGCAIRKRKGTFGSVCRSPLRGMLSENEKRAFPVGGDLRRVDLPYIVVEL